MSIETELRRATDDAQRSADGGCDLLKQLKELPRVAPIAGSFYRTLDGSILYIARVHKACQCSTCKMMRAARSGQLPPGLAEMMQNMGATPIGIAAVPQEAEGEGSEHDEAAPEHYVAIVIRGGHGLHEYNGEEPGEAVVLDAMGLVLLPDDKKAGVSSSCRELVGFAGLSLERELKCKLVDA